MKKFTVGLTGGIGSGKTTISDLFQELGVEIIDADVIAREIVEPKTPALNAIVDHFGKSILTTDNRLDRAQLRTIIFSSPDEKTWLNALLHPLIRLAIQQKIDLSIGNYCILSAPLLIENQLNKLSDHVLVVDVTEETQLKRTLQRDSSNQKEVAAIISSQISRIERQQAADDIINNESTDLNSLAEAVAKLHIKFESLSTK